MYSECLQLKDVTCWKKGETPVFHRLNWSMEQGERVMIIGYEGTELFDVIAGYKEIQEGELCIQGKLAIIREGFPLLETLILREYIELVLQCNGKKWNKKTVEIILKEHELWSVREYKSKELSVSERCRLQFALAQIAEPDIILMAQCWKRLQEEELVQFWSYVKKCLEQGNTSLLCFSDADVMGADKHQLIWEEIFSHIYVLKNGRLIER